MGLKVETLHKQQAYGLAKTNQNIISQQNCLLCYFLTNQMWITKTNVRFYVQVRSNMAERKQNCPHCVFSQKSAISIKVVMPE